MSIHYKFKSSLNYDTVTFDGLHISVRDLKHQILQQKKIGKNTDFDLQVTNAQTKETYTNENELIPKNASLIVARIPLTAQQKKQWDRDNNAASAKTLNDDDVGIMGKSVDITSLDIPEEEKIMTMMTQSTSEYDPSRYVKLRGGFQNGPVPPTYTCHRCHNKGHWIKDCPTNSIIDGATPIEAIRKNTGIPKSFMVPVDGPQVPGARMTQYGEFAVPLIDHEVYKEKKIEKPPFLAEKEKPVEATPIPEDLICGICKDLLHDAVMVPCCGTSFCDECIRGVLVESDDAECPECNEKDVSPDSLIPNRYLRNGVNSFKNQTGYVKKPLPPKGQSPKRPTLPDFVPPGQEAPAKPVEEEKKKEKDKSPESERKPDEVTNSLYDLAVEKNDKNASILKDDKNEPGSEDKKSKRHSPVRNLENGDKENIDSRRDRGNGWHKSRDGGHEQEKAVYAIQPIGSGPTPNTVMNMPPGLGAFPPRHMTPYMHGEDRSGTPTVDERYDPYARNMPHHGYQAPSYDPRYPPPGPLMPMGMGQPMQSFRGRGRPPYHHGPMMGPGPGPGSGPGMPPFNSNEKEDDYTAWMAWMKEKEERGNRRQDVRSRSRSPSAGRRRSYSPNRSRSRSRTSRRSVSRRRSLSPRTKSKSRSRSRSAPRFVISRSRSRSYSKSPKSPKKYFSPPRSPYRNDRYVDQYGGNRGFGGWERRGGYRGRGRGRGYNTSPQRQSNYSYNRFRDEYGNSPPRGYSPNRDRYRDQGRDRSPRWDDFSRHRRSRSNSKSRGYHDEDRVYHSASIERRSPSRGHRDREKSPRSDAIHSRDRRSRERSGRSDRSREKEKRHRGSRERSRSRDRKYGERARSRSVSRHRRSPSAERNKERSRRSNSPPHKAARKSEERSSPNRSKRTHESSNRRVTVVQKKSPPKTEDKPVADCAEKEPVVEKPKISSPATSESSKTQKKEKKKDKDKKKRKKEKETDEEREARKKRKREKREEKKRKLMATGRNEDVPEAEIKLSVEQIKNEGDLKNEEELGKDASPSFTNKLVTNPSPPVEMAEAEDPEPRSPSDAGLCTPSPKTLEEAEDVISPEMLARMPELSRWEIEDGGFSAPAKHSSLSPEVPRVTTEVLKRAENAIFKKAITAIRDPKKPSSDKPESERKVSEREKGSSESPSHSKERRVEKEQASRVTNEGPKKADMRKPSNSIQVTIPVTTENEEREVGFAPVVKTSKSPSSRVSVKDRLGSKVEAPLRKVVPPSIVVTRGEEKIRTVLSSAVVAHESRRIPLEESDFVPVYEESSDDNGRFAKTKRAMEMRKRSPETKKRVRSSSESSEESVKKAKKKRSKNKKDKKTKKKKKEVSDSSDSSDSEAERRKYKKGKRKKKSRH